MLSAAYSLDQVIRSVRQQCHLAVREANRVHGFILHAWLEDPKLIRGVPPEAFRCGVDGLQHLVISRVRVIMPKGPKAKVVNFALRLPPELHQLLVGMAAEDERSLNAEIVTLLRDAAGQAVRRRVLFNKIQEHWTKEEFRQFEEELAMYRDVGARLTRRRKKE